MKKNLFDESGKIELPVTFGTAKDISGEYKATFTIGVQGFALQPNGDKKHAEWYVEQLQTAFQNFHKLSTGGTGVLQAAKNLIDNWDRNLRGEREQFKQYPVGDKTYDYWSPASSMVASEFVATLRSEIEKLEQHG